MVAKFLRPKISLAMAGTTPWNPPKAKPVTAAEMPKNSSRAKALSRHATNVSADRIMRETVRGRLCSVIMRSGRKPLQRRPRQLAIEYTDTNTAVDPAPPNASTCEAQNTLDVDSGNSGSVAQKKGTCLSMCVTIASQLLCMYVA